MKTEIELTEAEEKLLVDVTLGGHIITTITKSENEFHVRYKYHGGKATGGRGIVYDIEGSWREAIENIRVLEAKIIATRVQKIH